MRSLWSDTSFLGACSAYMFTFKVLFLYNSIYSARLANWQAVQKPNAPIYYSHT